MGAFRKTYLLDDAPITLVKQQVLPSSPDNRELYATLRKADGSTMTIEGEGNGPIDAFVDALKNAFKVEFSFIDYHEHAVGRGANATAASYVEIQDSRGPRASRRGDGPEHRDGLAQGELERGHAAHATRGKGLVPRGRDLPPATALESEVKRGDALAVGDQADLDDAAALDDEVEDRERPSPRRPTSPGAPVMVAGCAAAARPAKIFATASPPRTSRVNGGAPTLARATLAATAAASARSTTPGSSTAMSAEKSPSRDAARKASTTSRCLARSASGDAGAP